VLAFVIYMYNYRTINGNVGRKNSFGGAQNVYSMCHKKEPFWFCPSIDINDILTSSTHLIASLG